MQPIVIGSLIEFAGIALLMIGSTRHSFPPPVPWLVPAIALIVFGNGMIIVAVLSRVMANSKKRDSEKRD